MRLRQQRDHQPRARQHWDRQPWDRQPWDRQHRDRLHRVLALGICALLVVSLPVFARSQTGVGAQLDQIFQQAYDSDGPGAAVRVQLGDQVLLRKGYGLANIELAVAVEPDMVFRLGSITKQFTAVAILMLEQEGKLSVNDPVQRFLPDYPTHGKTITIEHLLTHTSGIPSYTGLEDWRPTRRQDMSVEEMIAFFRDLPLEFDPGTQWRYNNSGYFLLGAVIEAVAETTYAEFVEERIFKPLGMNSSYYGDPERLIPRRASGYQRQGGEVHNAAYLSMSHPYAAGSLLSTVDDMQLWHQSLGSEELLSAERWQRAWTPYKLNDGEETTYGYGWALASFHGEPVVMHGGGINGFSTHMLHLPQRGLSISVLTNSNGASRSPTALSQEAALVATGRARPTAVDVDPKTLERYVGVYRIDDETTRVVTVEEGQLYTQRTGGGKSATLAASANDFFYEDSLSRFRFQLGEDGEVTGMIMTSWAGSEEEAVRTEDEVPEGPKVAQVDPALYDDYAGDYELAPGFVLTVSREGDRLMAQATGQSSIEVFPTSETEFFNETIGGRLVFHRDPESGAVTHLMLYQGGQEMRGERQP